MTTISQSRTSIDVEVTGQWLEALDLISGDEETGSLPDLLSDGTILCRLANRIKPGSIENVSTKSGFMHKFSKESLILGENTSPGLPLGVMFKLNYCSELVCLYE